MVRFFIIAIVIAIPTESNAQAFGVEEGQQVSKYGGQPALGPGAFKLTVPYPNQEFETYWALSHPTTGICKVWANGRIYFDDRYGTNVRTAYDRLRDVLNGRYGVGNPSEGIRTAAVSPANDRWVESIFQKSRTHATYWFSSTGAKLPQNVAGISLKVYAVSSSSSYVTLTYEFTNFDLCHRAIRSKDDAGL